MKKILLTVFAMCSLTTFAQFDLGVDVQSRYIWRGIQLGNNSASIQPYVEYSAGQFSIGAWGAYGLGGDGGGLNEADLYASWSPTDYLSITVTDYFFPAEGNNQGYWPYNNGHVFEGMISFSGVDGFPVGITVATNFGGADQKANGDQSYSTYIEASYSKSIGENGVEVSVFAGGVIGDEGGYYLTDGEGLINLGLGVSKEIKITENWSLPVNGALIFNPDADNIFLTFGFSL